MRSLLALVLISTVMAGCTPNIPVKRDFGASALTASGGTPSEFAAFNNYDPTAGTLVAEQICATPYVRTEERSLGAAPGRLVEETGHCATHAPLVGEGDWPFDRDR